MMSDDDSTFVCVCVCVYENGKYDSINDDT